MSNKKPVLFINMDKSDIPNEVLDEHGHALPNQPDPRYLAFWQEEERKVLEGITIDGFHISGWLYWHINHWYINKDRLMPNGDIVPDSGRPDLRDNELIVNAGLKRAQDPLNRRHLNILGARQIAKTTFEASFLGRSGLIYKGSQNLILSTNSGDLNNITASLDYGLLNCSPYFYVNRINKDWDAERVVLGTETKGRDRKVWSQFVVRNSAGGKKTEVGAGVTIKSGIYDEIGKDAWLESFKAAEKAMLSRFGIRAVFIAVGTGGNFEKGEDAKRAFFNPDSYRFVKYKQPDGRETGLFISGLFRQDCKAETTLADYLLSDQAKEDLQGELIPTSFPSDSELFRTVMYRADKELALERILEDREKARMDPDPRMFIKTLAYDPLTVDEIFLTDANNQFAHLRESMQKHQEDLKENYNPMWVDLYREPDMTVGFRSSQKTPVWDFPVKPKTITDAPVVMYEPPIKGAPYGTYICGIDPYNQDRSSESGSSLGVCYIMKRMYNPAGSFQNSIVCSYAGRPKTLNDFYQICENMIDLYRALALPENEGSIIQYFIGRKKEHLLFDSPALTRYINPNSRTADRQKGLAPTTPNQRHYMKLMLQYAEEVIKENVGGQEYDRHGLVRIPDTMLIEEMLSYKGKDSAAVRGVHEGNFDRICAFGHALTLSSYMDRDFPISGWDPDSKPRQREPSFISPFAIRQHDPDNPHTTTPFNLKGGIRSVF